MQHELNKTNTNTTIHDLFLYFKNLHALKKSNLYLRKIQISFFDKKIFGFTSNEDTNQF